MAVRKGRHRVVHDLQRHLCRRADRLVVARCAEGLVRSWRPWRPASSGCVATTAASGSTSRCGQCLPTRPHQVAEWFDPVDPAHRFTLQAAVLGARLLGWPERPLPHPGSAP
jgi:hypothetical protein